MKRLLKIFINNAFISLLPILTWFILSLTIDNYLTNIFAITFPLQSISVLIVCIFGVGACILKERENKTNAVYTGMVLGSILSGVCFGLILVFIDHYLEFINYTNMMYKSFIIYSILIYMFQTILSLILNKLYFEDKESKGNLILFIVNISNLLALTLFSIIYDNINIIIMLSLLFYVVPLFIFFIMSFQKFKFSINIVKCIKYDVVEVCINCLFLFVFLFGIKGTLLYNTNYISALSFITMLADFLWDSLMAVATCTKIDLAKNNFDYKKSQQNGFYLSLIALVCFVILFFSLFNLYHIKLEYCWIVLGIEIYSMLIYSTYKIKLTCIQLNKSQNLAAICVLAIYIIRLLISIILINPYVVSIAQCTQNTLMIILTSILFYKFFKVDNNGKLITKK